MELDPPEYTIHGKHRCRWLTEIQGCRIGTMTKAVIPYDDLTPWVIKVLVSSKDMILWGWNYLGPNQELMISFNDAVKFDSIDEAEQELALYLLKRSS